MNSREIFNRINDLLEEEGYQIEISDISELEDFLNDDINMDLESYDEIEYLYNELLSLDDEEEQDENFEM
mgnify:FL=1